MANEGEPKLFVNRWDDTSDPVSTGGPSYRDVCRCFDQTRRHPRARVGFHAERQDTSAAGWQRLLELVDEAAADGREEFRPLVDLTPDERRQIITLPPSIAKLTSVKRFVLYGSNLVRIPPEIGAMTSLEEFTPYTSYRLHWFPYEITRCSSLTRSTVSTRALFGNYKVRAPFPQLQPPQDSAADTSLATLDPHRWGTTTVRSCSVCDQPIELGGLHQVWISMRVATDVLPLLVNACSPACVAALPRAAEDHPRFPHTGGNINSRPPTGPDRRRSSGDRMARMTLPQPGDLTSLVLRTDFSHESVWEAVQAAVYESETAGATFVSDPAFADVSVQALVDADATAEDSDKICYAFIADATTMTSEDHPLLAVDLYDEPGRTFRLPLRWYADVSNNLTIANLDFADFAEATDASGTYRGFEGS